MVSSAVMVAMAWLLNLSLASEVAVGVAGIVVGFLGASIGFNHWEAVLVYRQTEIWREAQPPLPLNKLRFGIAIIIAFASTLLTGYVSRIFGSDIYFTAISVLFLFGAAVCAGYYLEHVILYYLHRSDSQLPTPDDPM